MNPAWLAYRVAAPFVGAVAPAARWLASPAERQVWDERMGHVQAPGGVHAWVHGASMGEVTGVGPLIRALGEHQPGLRVHLTATTRTGRARLRLITESASLAPIDSPQSVERFFRGVQPSRLILLETELWPHWLLRARAERVPVAVVSARLSPRSVGSYARLGPEFRELIDGLEGVLCQSAEDLDRWRALGARPDRSAVAGNLKFDALPSPVRDRSAAREALGLDPERPLLVLGSLRPGEAAVLAAAWQEQSEPARIRWQVVAVPRHAGAARGLREEAARAGVRSSDENAPSGGAWRWEDRSGVLMDYYRAAEVAVVGGSLLPYGGHNPVEPAACGAAVVMGPHHRSQLPGVRALLENGGVWVAGPGATLGKALRTLFDDPDLRARQVEGGATTVGQLRGAARRSTDLLVSWGLWPVR